MHIPDGLLSGGAAVLGYVASLAVHWFSDWKDNLHLKYLSRASVVTAALFVASLIHIPIGPTTVHFSFVGIAGIILGPLSPLAVTVSLLFQVILFQHGGFTSLGMNIFIFSSGALTAHAFFYLTSRSYFTKEAGISLTKTVLITFVAGGLAKLTLVLLGGLVLLSVGFHVSVPGTILLFHLPIILMEGIVTAAVAVSFTKLQRGVLYHEPKIYHKQ